MGQVIKFTPDEWGVMLALKRSIAWYAEKQRENDVYGTATRKEKNLLKYFITNLEREADRDREIAA